MPEPVLKQKKTKSIMEHSYGFAMSNEAYSFMKAHKEVDWAESLRKAMDEIIEQVKTPKKVKS